jgi:hypothetical protein
MPQIREMDPAKNTVLPLLYLSKRETAGNPVFLIKLILAEMTEKKKINSTMRRRILGLFLIIISLMMKKILIWPSTISIFRI